MKEEMDGGRDARLTRTVSFGSCFWFLRFPSVIFFFFFFPSVILIFGLLFPCMSKFYSLLWFFLLTHSASEKFPCPILVPWPLTGQVVALRRKRSTAGRTRGQIFSSRQDAVGKAGCAQSPVGAQGPQYIRG